MIHGGGWNSGSLELQVPMAQQIATKGYVTIPVEYRLIPEALYPAGVEDLEDAIEWIYKNAKRYGIDKKKIAVSGCSGRRPTGHAHRDKKQIGENRCHHQYGRNIFFCYGRIGKPGPTSTGRKQTLAGRRHLVGRYLSGKTSKLERCFCLILDHFKIGSGMFHQQFDTPIS